MIDFLDHISYSNLSLFEQCPRCWLLHYKYGVDLPGSNALSLGKQVHKAIERSHLDRQIPSVDDPAYPFLAAYSQRYKSKDYDEIEKIIEVTVKHPFTDKVLPIPIQMRIDRIHKNWIHDVKTSSKKWSFEDVDGRTQTAIYAYGFREYYGCKERGVIYDVLLKRKKPTLEVFHTYVDDMMIAKALLWVWKVYEEIERTMEVGEPQNHSHKCWRKGMLP